MRSPDIRKMGLRLIEEANFLELTENEEIDNSMNQINEHDYESEHDEHVRDGEPDVS